MTQSSAADVRDGSIATGLADPALALMSANPTLAWQNPLALFSNPSYRMCRGRKHLCLWRLVA